MSAAATTPAPPNIIWSPTDRQMEFLAADEDEVLYGGAAGGGKSDALIIDAMGGAQNAIGCKDYRAIILRRTYPELKEIIDRTRAIYPAASPGATFHEQTAEWRFRSGAKIELSYLDRDVDVMRYQSRQYQWIGWEELAQWPTESPYLYMISRLRAPARTPLRCYLRATCNPDGPGAKWLAKRFGILPSGQSTRTSIVTEGRTWRLRFIASRLDDNPHLSGTGYRERLLLLPTEIRRALLEGRWDEPIIGGAIYADALSKARGEGRITRVPHDPTLPVDTAWDLGVGDATSIWFSQSVGREVRLIDYYEASGEGLPHFVKLMKDKSAEHDYVYGRHVAPHDIAVREWAGGGKSRIDVAKSLGVKFEIAPNLPLEDGIHAVRMLFPMMVIDEAHCAAGLDALTHYRRDYNKAMGEYKAAPVHDFSSHGADALRYLAVAHKITTARRPERTRQVIQLGSSGSQRWMGS